MITTFKTQTLEDLIRQRNIVLGLAGVLLLSNLLLTLKVWITQEKWVLIPQFEIERRIEVSGSHFSKEYVQAWAEGILQDLLTVNPASVELKIARVLKITKGSYGDLKAKLEKMRHSIKSDQMSTVFYPKSFSVEEGDQKIRVQGDFLTFFGSDKTPVIQSKTFILGYTRGINGVILLASFEEIKNEKA